MIKVQFLTDYRGVLTGEAFFRAGEETQLPNENAKILQSRGIVKFNAVLPPAETAVSPLRELPISKLKNMAKEQGISGYWNMKRDSLIEKLEEPGA